jgi:DNA helicase-2/ATP-dependent DNA helicase PcrA
MKLRSAQEEILKYRGGLMGISAVPGSGKTFTLSLLAAELLASGKINSELDQEVLIVTYLNSSVDTFRSRIRARLAEISLPEVGYDVRTLHSLALEIVHLAEGGYDFQDELPVVANDAQVIEFLGRAVDGWIDSNVKIWHSFLDGDSPSDRVRWRTITENTAQAFIRTAKNQRYTPEKILDRILKSDISPETLDTASYPIALGPENQITAPTPLMFMMAGIYQRYQSSLINLGALDYDDLIWRAADLLEQRPDVAIELRQRWPFVLEDEAQDSVPLQEILLNSLVGPDGNWVRVGDPNQAITSTFTAADPQFFNNFIERPDVQALPLPNSGRCAPKIYKAANRIVHWVCDQHPVDEVRHFTFRPQDILPTPPGDAQPNPPDSEAKITIKVYRHREEEEIPTVSRLAMQFTKTNPQETLAILVPTHDMGHQVSLHLDELGASYDNLLRGSKREREIAAVLQAILNLLAEPLDKSNFASILTSLNELGHPAGEFGDLDQTKILAILRSIYNPESFLFPENSEAFAKSFPAGVVTEPELRFLENFQSFLERAFELRPLPVDDLILTLSDELFESLSNNHSGFQESDLAIAYHIASVVRQWRDLQPDWRLPELTTQLADIAEGRRQLRSTRSTDFGFQPTPGSITLATQHGAKGMEWDCIFLVGIDGRWLPGSLESSFLGVQEFLGGDPTAEVRAQLRYLMEGDAGLYPDRTATESAHIDIICERLRLFYVGITRARKILHISRSRQTRRFNKEYESEPATVMGFLYQFLNEYPG